MKNVEEIAIKNENEMNMIPRRSIIVWVYNFKNINNLKRFGIIHYMSRRMKYVVVYMDEKDTEVALKKIKQLHFVREAELSYRPDIVMDFNNRLGTAYSAVVSESPSDYFEIEELKANIKLAENV